MTAPTPPTAPYASAGELSRLGITRVKTEHFQLGPYRYTRLADALAQARRAPTPGNDR
jgi:hypothetical protein